MGRFTNMFADVYFCFYHNKGGTREVTITTHNSDFFVFNFAKNKSRNANMYITTSFDGRPVFSIVKENNINAL